MQNIHKFELKFILKSVIAWIIFFIITEIMTIDTIKKSIYFYLVLYFGMGWQIAIDTHNKKKKQMKKQEIKICMQNESTKIKN